MTPAPPQSEPVSNRDKARANIAAAFTEWHRRFTEEPEQFEQDISKFDGLSYGETCAEYLIKLMDEA